MKIDSNNLEKTTRDQSELLHMPHADHRSLGHTVEDKIENFLNQGCEGFIKKPFSMHEFSHALRKILDKS